jgi:hypothetical protein
MRISDVHKSALVNGRAEGKIIREYLELVEDLKPRRGRRRTKDSISKRLNQIEAEIVGAEPVRRLYLIQERMNLRNEFSRFRTREDHLALEKAFISVARSFSERNHVTFEAWKEFGIDIVVLDNAQIHPS